VLNTRTASVSESTAIAELWTVANTARRAALDLGPVAEADDDSRAVRLRLGAPRTFAFVVEEDGRLVAIALAMQALAQDGASPVPVPGLLHVSMVAVHPDAWGRHLGALVLESTQREGRKRGFTSAQLWTHETNRRAQRLYERLGWTVSGRTKADDSGEPIRHYVRPLDDGQ